MLAPSQRAVSASITSFRAVNPTYLTSPTRFTNHGITADRLDADALDVVRRLVGAGYEAYLVGGCVRDALLGHKPKDFDVATNAHPDDVRRIFSRSRLVGRRFRIAHVRYGRNIIEVTTFRSARTQDVVLDDTGLILQDNAYGTIEEDAFRRDFTVNALYYDPLANEVIDYVGGMQDITGKQLKLIGDPEGRLIEDPVRLLRAIRFQAKLNFVLDEKIQVLVSDIAKRLEAIPPARLFEEYQKLFLAGCAVAAWNHLKSSPVGRAMFPHTDPANPLIDLAMANTDRRVHEGKPVTPAFLLAVMLWDEYCSAADELAQQQKPALAAEQAAFNTLARQQAVLAIPRRFSQFVRDVWYLQNKLTDLRVQSVARVFGHQRFRAAYDFLLLRAEAGEPLADNAQWWTSYQEQATDERRAMVEKLPPAAPRKRRRRRRSGASRG